MPPESSKYRFSLLRLFCGVTVFAIGCLVGTLFTNPGEGLVVVCVSLGASVGVVFKGWQGSFVGAGVTWLLLGPVLLFVAIVMCLRLLLLGK